MSKKGERGRRRHDTQSFRDQDRFSATLILISYWVISKSPKLVQVGRVGNFFGPSGLPKLTNLGRPLGGLPKLPNLGNFFVPTFLSAMGGGFVGT